MVASKGWWKTLGGILGFSSDGRQSVHEILAQRYVEERQHARQLAYHAERMQYPQFRERLSAIAADEARHAQWVAEKIRALGGTPPNVPEISLAGRNSWQSLLADLEEHRQCAAELLMQISRVKADFPAVADTLQRIYDESVQHRAEIREMLMRSDPQAHLAA
jgi:rubrerythrin